jgi:ABC-type bacteriocin/lantibiotic exporter with double-glycine peptidase domain
MTTILDILITTLGIAYFLGAIDAFFDLGKLKGFVALIFSAVILYLIGYWNNDLLVLAPACAYLALAVSMLVERPTTVQPLRRL